MLKARGKRYRQALKLCQRACSDRAVHFLRTAGRRLLASLELHAAVAPDRRVQSARRILKEQLRRFSDLRDTHVQLVLAARLPSEFPGRDAFVDALRRQESRQMGKACDYIDRLSGEKLRKLIKALRKELPPLSVARARAVTRAKLADAFARVSRRRAQIDPDDTATIHRTRVAFKKFRYLLEGLAGALPEIMPPRRQVLRTYQRMMGEIQDWEIFLASLREFTEQTGRDGRLARSLFADLEQRRQALVARYLRRAGELERFQPPSPKRTQGIARSA